MPAPERHRRLAAALPEPDPPVIADLGSGTGRTLLALRERLGDAVELIARRAPRARAGSRADRRREAAHGPHRPQQAPPVRRREPRRGGLPQHARGARLRRVLPRRGRARPRPGRPFPAQPHRPRHRRLQLRRAGPDPRARPRVRGHPGGVDGLRRRHDRPQARLDRAPLGVRARRVARLGRDRHGVRRGRGRRPRGAADQGAPSAAITTTSWRRAWRRGSRTSASAPRRASSCSA